MSFNRIQNAVVDKLTALFSESLHTTVSIEHVDWRFSGKLSLKNIYISDQNGDTLLSADRLEGRARLWKLVFKRQIEFPSIELIKPDIRLHIDESGTANFAFLTDLLPKRSSSKRIALRFDHIALCHGHLIYRNAQRASSVQHRAFDANDVEISELNLQALFEMTHDKQMSVAIKELNFGEKSGFEVRHLTASAQLNDSLCLLPRVHIALPHSQLNLDTIAFGFNDLSHLLSDQLQISAQMQTSHVYLPDLQAFLPECSNLRQDLTLSARLYGNLSDLQATDLQVRYGTRTSFDGDFHFVGLPDIRHTYVDAQLNDIRFDTYGIQDIAAAVTRRPIVLPPRLHNVGICHYRGKVEGTIDQLRLDGDLSTNIGKVFTNVGLQFNDSLMCFTVDGRITSKQLQLGQLVPPSAALGSIAFDASTHINLCENAPLKTHGDLTINHLTFRDYDYRNIRLTGDYTDKAFDGHIVIEDENLKLNFNGKVNWNAAQYSAIFDANIADFSPYTLNLITTNPNLIISTGITSQFAGSDIDHMEGDISFHNLLLDNDSDFALPDLVVQSHANGTNSLAISSDLISGAFEGDYTLTSLFNSGKQMVEYYFPILKTSERPTSTNCTNQIAFHLDIADTKPLAEALNFGWFTRDTIIVEGIYHDQQRQMDISIDIPEVCNTSGGLYRNLAIDINNFKERLNCNLYGEVVTLKNDTITCQADLYGRNDSLATHLQWHNVRTELTHAGEVLLLSHFAKEHNKTQADIKILPTQIVVQNTPFDILSSKITTDFERIAIDQLYIGSENQHIYIDGTASKSESDSLDIALQNINLEFISTLIPPTTPIEFGGVVSGSGSVRSAFSRPIIKADVSGDSFSFNGAYLGNVRASSWWENDKNCLAFAGQVVSDMRDTVAVIDGGYYFPNDSLDLIGHAEHLNIKFIEPFMENILQDIDGTASGDVHVYGHTLKKDVLVTVDAMAENAQASVGYLGATFFFNDSIRMTPDSILLTDIDIYDTEGNQALLNGVITHDYFTNLNYRINISCHNFKALNTTAKDNDLFYGTAHATGTALITGDDYHTNIFVDATTEKNTKLVVPIGASVATENTFITFVNREQKKNNTTTINPYATATKAQTSEMSLNLMVNVTPNAEVLIYVDPKSGDVLKATGDGDIRIEYNDKTEKFKMYGNYEIEQGSYLFSFQEAIRKEFKVKQGGTVDWSGDPVNPRVNIDGYYQLNASLLDILDQSYLESSNRTTVPVQCLLNLTGNLSNPAIKFDIYLPNSDEELNRALKSAVNTDEMVTREIIYLLVLGKFFTPETMKNTGTTFTQSDLLAVASSTVSAQLNNWASQMFENWNFGVNFRSTDLGDSYSNEYEFNFLYTPNNRITINGNVGYRDDNLSASKFIGDFDIEYKLIQSGKLSAKAYTHTNDYKEFKTALTTQGVGLVYRENFDSGKDLIENWKSSIAENKRERAERKAQKAAKKQTAAPQQPADTIQ